MEKLNYRTAIIIAINIKKLDGLLTVRLVTRIIYVNRFEIDFTIFLSVKNMTQLNAEVWRGYVILVI